MRAVLRKLLFLLPAVALAGCGQQAPQRAAKLDDGPVAYADSDYYEQDQGVPGGTLRISSANDAGTLDFQTIAHTTPKWLGRLIYDNLVYLDPQGRATPWLAKSWEISPDGKTYTFHLRDDVTFSDGTRLDAAAVKANLDRIRDPATKAAMTTAYIAPYAKGRVVDDFTFEATLSEPYGPFLNVLAQSWLGMMSPKALRENPKGLGEHPVGSGPFTVESYVRQKGAVFVRRPDYRWAPDYLRHKGPAYLDRVVVDVVPEAMARYTSLAAGQYDLTMDAPPQNVAAIRADDRLAIGNRINLGNPVRAVTFNTSRPPFDDVRVRQAFTIGLDREGIARSIGFGEYRPTVHFLSATTPYFDPSVGAALAYDPAKAGALLDAAGWTGRDAAGYRTKAGQRLGAEILVPDSGASGPLMVAVQSDAKKIGFDLVIRQLPAAMLVQRREANQYQALAGGYWHTNTPDGLYILYHSRQISSPAYIGQNTSRLQDLVLDDLLGRARRSTDPVELKGLYSKAQARLTEVVPAAPLYENHTLLAYRRDVRGLVYDTSHNVPFFITTWLKRPAQ